MLRVTSTARDLSGMARVTRHQRPHVGAVGSVGTGKAPAADLVEGGGRDAGGPAAGDAEPDEPDPADDGHGEAEPAGPVVERAEPDEEGGGDHLPDDVLEGQLAGDPAARRRSGR